MTVHQIQTVVLSVLSVYSKTENQQYLGIPPDVRNQLCQHILIRSLDVHEHRKSYLVKCTTAIKEITT